MTNYGGVSGGMLRSFIERIEHLEEEKKEVAEQIKEVFAEAKANGFDAKIMKQVIKLRKMDQSDRQEQESLLEVYMQALGMIPSLPTTEEVRAEMDAAE